MADDWYSRGESAHKYVSDPKLADQMDKDRGKGVYYVPQAAPSPSGGPPPPPPPPPKPHNPWITTSDYSEPVGVKQADPDIVLFDTENISPELLLQLSYEDISGTELINISRSDIIDGRNVVYSPIKNISGLRRRFNPNNIIAMPSTSSSLFSKYPIDLINREPYEPYFNDDGDLVIEIENIREDEVIEVEVDSSGTINTVDFS
jgi:hypothetical protein